MRYNPSVADKGDDTLQQGTAAFHINYAVAVVVVNHDEIAYIINVENLAFSEQQRYLDELFQQF